MSALRSTARLVLATLVLLVAVAPSTAHADDASKAKSLFDNGNKAFDDGRYSDALAAYRASYALVERPSTLFNIAVCSDRLGDHEGAYVDYEAFLAIATDSPADAERMEKSRARLVELDESLGIEVIVTSSPAGAAVYFEGDDAIVGRTPIALLLPIGVTEIRLEAPGHLAESAEIAVRAGAKPRADVELAPLAKLTLTATPSNATIEIEGDVPRSAAGRLDAELAPGTYVVTVRAEGFESKTTNVTVESGSPASKHIALQALPPPERDPDPTPLPIPVRSSPRGKQLRYGGIALGAVGVVALAFGVERGLTASARSDDAQAAAVGGTFDADLYDSARSAENMMIVMYALGVASIGGGVVAYLLSRRAGARAETTRSVTIAPAITPSGATVGISGSF